MRNLGIEEIPPIEEYWKELKMRGRLALGEDGKRNFDRLYEILLKGGLLVNPCGELESTMSEYIEYSTDKRAWFERAMKLVPNLLVEDQKYPWKLLKDLHRILGG